MRSLCLALSGLAYRLLRPLLFLTDSEWIHGALTHAGEFLGGIAPLRAVLRFAWRVESPTLVQTLHGIRFENPIGLAAGFDYEARLTEILPAIGFGFGTVGTITNQPYEGNPYPRLGRLIRSRSLLVNKGFKNLGIAATLAHLGGKTLALPVGLSLGKTNTRASMTQAEAQADVLAAFRAAEASAVPFGYYELNISCPNLYGNVEFYSPQHLDELLRAVTSLKLRLPVFIKMPIDKSDDETRTMLGIIAQHPIAGVIFGNLQKNRHDPAIIPEEAARYGHGNFSGKPTEKRSNELIRLAYLEYGSRLTIIGCGGVANAEDAYRKIRLGASLVELITGLVYEGPQLAGAINDGLVKLLRRDNLTNVREAVGMDA